MKTRLTYDQFIGFSFQLIVAVQTIHVLDVIHGDIKHSNYIVCDTDNDSVTYKDGKSMWFINYREMNNKYVKLIDFGYAYVGKKCSGEKRDRYNLVLIMDFMKSKTDNFNDEYTYKRFIEQLKDCDINLKTVLHSEIFDSLKISKSNSEYVVDLL